MKKSKTIVMIAVLCLAALLLSSCEGTISTPSTEAGTTASTNTSAPVTDPVTPASPDTEDPTGSAATPGTGETPSAPAEVFEISLSDASIDVGSSGAVAEGSVLTISKAGSYRLTGTLSNGEVVVKVSKEEQVELILAGVNITNSTGPAIYCDSADKLYVTVEADTVNTLKDGKNYALPDGPNAPLYSDDDLTIRGSGTLNVKGYFKNGISSKNDIKIKEVTLNVESYNTGVRGKGSVTVQSGVVEIIAGNDGIKSTDDTKADKGFVEISGGTVVITAGDDGIQAATVLTLSGGSVKITAEGKITNAPTQNISDGVLS